MGFEFARYRKLVVTKYHDGSLRSRRHQLHFEAFACGICYLCLATRTSAVFHDEQLRILNFHKEAASAKGYPVLVAGKATQRAKERTKAMARMVERIRKAT